MAKPCGSHRSVHLPRQVETAERNGDGVLRVLPAPTQTKGLADLFAAMKLPSRNVELVVMDRFCARWVGIDKSFPLHL